MNKIAVIGDSLSVSIFKSQGIDVYESEKIDVCSLLKEINGNYKIIFITEDVYEKIESIIQSLESIVTVLPSIKSNKKIGERILKKISIIATGTELE